jgi:glutamate dehydrogenase/leucine dehydrogenase
MSDATARLAMPVIVPGQAQKEMIHNEALAILDAAVQASVVAIGANAPPVDPADGACWIVGESPTGVWAGRSGALAAWTVGGWRYIAPTPGFRVWVAEMGVEARFVAGQWVLATPADVIAPPSGGATIDSQARDAIAALIAALQHHDLLRRP